MTSEFRALTQPMSPLNTESALRLIAKGKEKIMNRRYELRRNGWSESYGVYDRQHERFIIQDVPFAHANKLSNELEDKRWTHPASP